jgi:phosphatidylglycerophosphate synthase
MTEMQNRRPLKSRGAAWANNLARLLSHYKAHPDTISAASLAFAILGGALLLFGGGDAGWTRALAFLGAAGCIQLRLLCNLLDGLVAVEHRRGSAVGPIWNELPDRFADVLLLAGAGYGAASAGMVGGTEAGWICASLALMTAYVRELGRGFGFPPDFSGPMAKPQRMAALTLTAVVSAVEKLWGWHGQTLLIGLAVIGLGTALTLGLRTRTLARRLAQQHGEEGDDR